MNLFIPLFVAVPLGGAFISAIIGTFVKKFSRFFTSVVLAFLTGLAVYIIFTVKGTLVVNVGGWELFGKIPIAIYLVVDGLSIYLLLIINIIGFLSAFYSISYIKKFTGENNYYILFCLMVAGMNGVVISGDLFNIYVFLEMAAIASYALVAFGIEKEELEASFKYQVLGGISSLFILLGIGFLYWSTSTLNIADISRIILADKKNELVIFAQVILLSGFGLKAALIPFHAWPPG